MLANKSTPEAPPVVPPAGPLAGGNLFANVYTTVLAFTNYIGKAYVLVLLITSKTQILFLIASTVHSSNYWYIYYCGNVCVCRGLSLLV